MRSVYTLEGQGRSGPLALQTVAEVSQAPGWARTASATLPSMECYLYECHHEQAGTWGMLLPWNVKPEWPGVTVHRILPVLDEVEGVTCLEA